MYGMRDLRLTWAARWGGGPRCTRARSPPGGPPLDTFTAHGLRPPMAQPRFRFAVIVCLGILLTPFSFRSRARPTPQPPLRYSVSKWDVACARLGTDRDGRQSGPCGTAIPTVTYGCWWRFDVQYRTAALSRLLKDGRRPARPGAGRWADESSHPRGAQPDARPRPSWAPPPQTDAPPPVAASAAATAFWCPPPIPGVPGGGPVAILLNELVWICSARGKDGRSRQQGEETETDDREGERWG